MLVLIEDNGIDEKLTLRALRESGVATEIIVLRDGAEAVDFLKRQGKYASREGDQNPSLIFLDLKVPKINGLEVLKIIRDDQRTELLPVVVLSSSIEQKDLVECYRIGANSYIRKQVDFEKFLQTMSKVCDYWLALNQGPPLEYRCAPAAAGQPE